VRTLDSNGHGIAADVERVVRQSIRTAGRYKFHWHHRRQAQNALRTLEKAYGKPDPAHLQLADAYARDVFGDAVYAPWLRVYTVFNRTFKEGWIPDNFYGSVVVPSLKGWHGKISNLKTMSRLIFRSDAFPDVGYYANGLFLTADNVVIPDAQVRSVLFRDTDRIVYKLDGSGQGAGIFIVDEKSFDTELIRAQGNGVMQAFIRQHRVFDEFMPSSVATLRFTTVVDDSGAISVRSCFVRIGRKGETHVTAHSDVCVPIDLTTGAFDRKGYLGNWLAVDAHPDTGKPFAGVSVPAFQQCLSTVLDLHSKIPFARCIGWDLAVDQDENVKVMEWNAEHNDVKFSEATQGPCFSDLKWERLSDPLGQERHNG
jgi:hypothetical protein